MFRRTTLGSNSTEPQPTRGPRLRLTILATVSAMAITACGGPTIGAQSDEIPDQLALDDETTTSSETTTTVAEPASDDEGSIESTTTDVPPAETSTTAAPATTAAPVDNAPADNPPVETTQPVTSAPAETSAPVTSPPATDADDRSFQLLNELRVSLGLTPLVRDTTMDEFARSWSAEMGSTGNFEHSDAPYGENIAFASDTSQSGVWAAETFNTNWIDSPGHYANMTNANYTTIGVGIVLTDNGWYGTHVFK